MPPFLSSLLHRTRVAVLTLLLVVLPLQSVTQLVAGVQGHRHVHAGSMMLSGLMQPLRAVLDRLHAAQDPRLAGVSREATDGWHRHGGLLHQHSPDTHDAVDVGDEAQQPGATAFLAWLPSAPTWAAGQAAERPAAPTVDWRDRVVAPPLTPPRG